MLVPLSFAACASEDDPGPGLLVRRSPSAGAPSGAGGAGLAGVAGAPDTLHPPAGAGGQGGDHSSGTSGQSGAAGSPAAGQGGSQGSAGGAASGGTGSASGGSDAAGLGGGAGTSGAPAGGQDGKGGGASSGGQAGGAQAGCPGDMVPVESFCMDRYEAPNQLGALPLAMQTAPEGEAWCGERGKRLCTEDEWLRACEGPAQTTYPYGDTHEAHRCNDDKTWISPDWTALASWPSEAAQAEAAQLYQADPSGDRAGCVSTAGVVDLTGNVAEWVVRSFPTQKNYDHVLKGCYWSKCYGGSEPSCGFVNGAHPGTFRTYEAGFRCCLTPAPPSP